MKAPASLRTLGGFSLQADGIAIGPPSTALARALLCYLALHPDEDVAREVLMEAFWPGRDPDRARASLSTALWAVRRSLRAVSKEPFEAGRSSVRWTLPLEFDALSFLDLAARGDRASRERALQLYRGEFLPGDYREWTVAYRERILFAHEELLAKAVRETPDCRTAVAVLERNPYDEAALEMLIAAALDTGNVHAAQALFTRAQGKLAEVDSTLSPTIIERMRARTQPVRGAADFHFPFVGRERELRIALDAIDTQRAGVIILRGLAGFGKSALLEQIARYALRLPRRALRITAAPSSNPFGVWAKTYETITGKTFKQLATEHPRYIASSLVNGIIQAFAHPALLLVDDAHRFTNEGRHICLEIARQAVAHGSLVILATRPEASDAFVAAFSDVQTDEIEMLALREEDLAEALRVLTGTPTDSFVQVLFERTKGHPLFVVRLLNELVAKQTLVHDGHRWELHSIPKGYALPHSIRTLVESRLRERGEAASNLASALALEPSLSTMELARLLDCTENAVLDAFDDLMALGVMHESDRGPMYVFAHELIREVAASAMNAARRRRLHKRLAEIIVAREGHGQARRRALHLELASEEVDAAHAYADAAEESLTYSAWHDAVTLSETGRAMLARGEHASDPQLDCRLLCTSAMAHIGAGDIGQAAINAGEAVRTARHDLHEPAIIARALLVRARTRSLDYAFETAVADAAEAAQLALTAGDDLLHAQALARAAAIYASWGRVEESTNAASAACESALRAEDYDLALYLLGNMLVAQLLHWRFDKAMACASRGEALFERAAQRAEAEFRYNRAMLYFLLDRFEEARTDITWALAHVTASTSNNPYLTDPSRLRFICENVRGIVAATTGDFEEALSATEAMLRSPVTTGSPVLQAFAVDLRVDVLLQRDAAGDADAASSLLGTVNPAVWSREDLPRSAHLGRARVAARLRDPEARPLLEQALERALVEARLQPQDIDRDFLKIAQAAAEIHADDVAARAAELAGEFFERRHAAAGPYWGTHARAPLRLR